VPAPEFVALADLLRGAAAVAETPSVPQTPAAQIAMGAVASAPRTRTLHDPAADNHREDVASAEIARQEVGASDVRTDVVEAAREARMFRARLADAFDDAVVRLVRELAVDVLARELRLAPCDVPAIARRVLERAPVVRLRVAPQDADSDFGLPIVVDPDLRAGDAVFELVGGALDARLGVRLATVLDAVSTDILDALANDGGGSCIGHRDGAVR
jgi:hypothetical protein